MLKRHSYELRKPYSIASVDILGANLGSRQSSSRPYKVKTSAVAGVGRPQVTQQQRISKVSNLGA